jgi:signal transduction histidine kinase
VVDQGIGILRKDQPHVFEKFFRSDEARLKEPEGNGLGLFIAKSYIEAHKGHVTFVSPRGKGATFTISLPIV